MCYVFAVKDRSKKLLAEKAGTTTMRHSKTTLDEELTFSLDEAFTPFNNAAQDARTVIAVDTFIFVCISSITFVQKLLSCFYE